MRLIGFVVVLGFLVLAPVAAEAQDTGRVWRVGIVRLPSPAPGGSIDGFLLGLTALGYIEGKNLIVIQRSAEGKIDRLPDLVAELLRLKVDLIASENTEAIVAAKGLTSTTPIVMTSISDPIGNGLVASFARPGGNVTGVTLYSSELAGKRLQALVEAVPRISTVAVLVQRHHPPTASFVSETEAAARVLRLQLRVVPAYPRQADIAHALATMSTARVGALIVQHTSSFLPFMRPIAALAIQHRLPTMHSAREFVEAGRLMAYGPNTPALGQQAAVYADKIFKGAKPADLPIEQPTKFEQVINLRTAKLLGVTIPHTLLLRADQVIE